MTVSSTLNKQIYTGNGTTKIFDYTFYTLAEGDLKLYLTNITTGVETEITANYDVSPTGDEFPASSGTVTYPVVGDPITSNYKVTILRTMDVLQLTVYPNNTSLKPKVIEKSFDRITMIAQQLQEQLSRSLVQSISADNDISNVLPTPVANQLLRWDNTATKLENAPPEEDSAAAALLSADNAAASAIAAEASAILAHDHIIQTTGAHEATAISNTPAGNISSITIQSALNELDTEKISNPSSSSQGDLLYNNGTIWTRLAAGTAGLLLKTNGTGANPSWGIPCPVAICYEYQAAGTAGGTFNAGAWRIRIINTISIDQIGISVVGNRITLPAGTYEIMASSPAFAVNSHKIRLYNTTDSSVTLIGTSGFSNASYSSDSRSFISGAFNISSSKTFEIQHYCGSTAGTNGFGYPCSIEDSFEVYTQISIRKVG